jgi:anti-sigma B factor antagonist
MPYMNCPRCGLSVRLRPPYLTLQRCPRCIAKFGISVPMQISEGPGDQPGSEKPTTPPRAAGEPSDFGDELFPGGLVIRATREREVLVLELRGELALASAPVLEQRLHDEEAIGVGLRVVIDLSGLEFFDSAGLHVLLNAQQRLREHGTGLFLRRGPRGVQRVFELTDTASSFWFED